MTVVGLKRCIIFCLCCPAGLSSGGAQVTDGTIIVADAPLAYFQPKFIVEQVLASCKFEGIKPQFTPQNTKDALANLFIQSHSKSKMGVMR